MSERKMLQTVYKHNSGTQLGVIELVNDFICHRPQFHHRHDNINNNNNNNNNNLYYNLP